MAKSVELHSCDFDWNDHARACAVEDLTSSDSSSALLDVATLGEIARTKWDEFHQRNHGKAYKPRNYLVAEFPELQDTSAPVRVLEVGCGYGSAILPVLASCAHVTADVCDFSASAIDILKQNASFDPTRCNAFVCDIVADALPLADASVDVVLMVFVLSALPPDTFASVLQKIARVLKPGGVVCLRDYGLYDLAMRRNAKRVAKSLYYRSDGTLAYFFSKEDVVNLFQHTLGWQIIENEYCTVRLVNRKKQQTMDRVWIHAKCKKPLATSDTTTQQPE